jgi:hypothetical protein
MVTGFVIEKGYAYDGKISNEDLLEIVKSVTVSELYLKAQEFGLLQSQKTVKLCYNYETLPTEDLTCYFTYDEHGDIEIRQSCSGGGIHRVYREIICRAFGILVLEKAFKKGYAVNFGSY